MNKIKRLMNINVLQGVLLALICQAGAALACDPADDGCLGCTEQALPACMEQVIIEICNIGGGVENCDKRRVYDDLERQIITNTGRHMVRINVMMRSARKYQSN